MKTLTVQVNSDHLRSLSQTKKPILALAELIWNSLDADAHNVSVSMEYDVLNSLKKIRVLDDGHGLDYGDVERDFSNLGGSWKKTRMKSKKNDRILHGRLGKGRFRAFALGQYITWVTRYRDNNKVKEYSITGRINDPGHFSVSDPIDTRQEAGTEVIVDNIVKNFSTLCGDRAIQEIASHFALYLRQYPNVSIKYDGTEILTGFLESGVYDYSLPSIHVSDGSKEPVILTIIEWKQPQERSLYLCDSRGFALHEVPVGIHARRFNFTAYIKSEYLRKVNDDGCLELAELDPTLKQVIESAKSQLRSHFRKRSADEASLLVKNWKDQKIYPYEDDAKTPIEEAERQVFDVCALNIHTYLPDFDEVAQKNKRLTFHLLKNALETSPAAIQIILGQVLELPKKKQEEFAELIQETSLDAIITASATVASRLKFLRGLEAILFDPEFKNLLKERSQLHRMLAHNTWIFGEEYHLTLDDQSLTELLRKHRSMLGDDADIVDDVLREDGTRGILDIVLGRKIPTPRGDNREHLVIELKRPKKRLDDESLTQIRSYAFAVASDERFKDTNTKWDFWLISNEMNDAVRRQAKQKNLPLGCIYEDDEDKIKIWVKTWGQIIEDCDGRLKFFQEQLQFNVSKDGSLDYLRSQYSKYLPEIFQSHQDAQAGENSENGLAGSSEAVELGEQQCSPQ